MLSKHKNGKKPFNTLLKLSNAIPTIMSSTPIDQDHIAIWVNIKKHSKMQKNVLILIKISPEVIKERAQLSSIWTILNKLFLLINKGYKSILIMLR